MAKTHFSGPILFSGKGNSKGWFENLPIDRNPDYMVYMDDFTGVTLDNTNDLTVVKDSGASAAIAAEALLSFTTVQSFVLSKATPVKSSM